MSDDTYALAGIWTPWAAVLCYPCHGATGPVSQADVDKWSTPQIPENEETVTRCDKCNEYVFVAAGVAAEHNLVLELREAGLTAQMDQTGGMCSAAQVNLDEGLFGDGPDHLLITDSETRDHAGEAFLIGYYPYGTYGYDRASEGVLIRSDGGFGGSGTGIDEDVPADRIVALVKEIKARYDAGERNFGGEW